jgi:hypothetical protein
MDPAGLQTALVGIAAAAVTSLGIAVRALVKIRQDELRVRAEIDHVLNNFAQVLIGAMDHAARGDWQAAERMLERWAEAHPPKKG